MQGGRRRGAEPSGSPQHGGRTRACLPVDEEALLQVGRAVPVDQRQLAGPHGKGATSAAGAGVEPPAPPLLPGRRCCSAACASVVHRCGAQHVCGCWQAGRLAAGEGGLAGRREKGLSGAPRVADRCLITMHSAASGLGRGKRHAVPRHLTRMQLHAPFDRLYFPDDPCESCKLPQSDSKPAGASGEGRERRAAQEPSQQAAARPSGRAGSHAARDSDAASRPVRQPGAVSQSHLAALGGCRA